MVRYYCAVDGVTVALARSGKWVHTEGLGEKVPEHDVKVMDEAMAEDLPTPLADLRRAAGEMLMHHATIHPVSDCAWYKRLMEAWKATGD